MEGSEEHWSHFEEQWWPWSPQGASTEWDYNAAGIHEHLQSATYYESAPGVSQNIDIPASNPALDNFAEIFDLFCQQNTASEPGIPESPELEPLMPSAPSSETLYSPAPHDMVHESLRDFVSQDDVTVAHYSPEVSLPNIEDRTTIASLMASSLHVRTKSDHPVKNAKRVLQAVPPQIHYPGTGCSSKTTAKRRKLTQKQLENQQKVRALGACLRCYGQNCTCSEDRPCRSCQVQLGNNRNTRSLVWTKCVSASLPDLNIFALGVPILEDDNRMAGGSAPKHSPSLTTALPMYALLFEINVSQYLAKPVDGLYDHVLQHMFADGAPDVSQSMLMEAIDDLYKKVSRHRYGDRASEAHPFLLTDSNPLYTLVKLNVVLLGSPILGTDLIGCVRYLQKVRSICAIVAFEYLGKAFRRTTLAAASLDRQSGLIVQIALLLDQVVEMSKALPAAALSCSRGQVFEEMRQGLIQYLTYYLHKLVPGVSAFRKFVVECIRRAEFEGHLKDEFWAVLSDLIPHASLNKPPVLRQYVDFSWDGCGVDEGEALCDYFATHCSIACM